SMRAASLSQELASLLSRTSTNPAGSSATRALPEMTRTRRAASYQFGGRLQAHGPRAHSSSSELRVGVWQELMRAPRRARASLGARASRPLPRSVPGAGPSAPTRPVAQRRLARRGAGMAELRRAGTPALPDSGRRGWYA